MTGARAFPISPHTDGVAAEADDTVSDFGTMIGSSSLLRGRGRVVSRPALPVSTGSDLAKDVR